MTKIIKRRFDESLSSDFSKPEFRKSWPVVYVLEGKKEAYVGETTNFIRRMHDHLSNQQRKNLSEVYLISDEKFNKSATLDIESKLIEYMAADGKYELQNSNRGLRDHNYYNRDYYLSAFENIWDSLRDIELVRHSLRDIRNSDLFKMSPFKVLTEEQYDIVESIENILKIQDRSNHIIHGEPGSGKTVLAIYLMKYLLSTEAFSNKRIGLVVPMTSLRNSVKKVFKSVKGLKSSMVIGPYDVNKGDKYDLLIVDEAHRLTRRKNLSNYSAYDKVCNALGIDKHTSNQLDWIKLSSHHMVLFYDQRQTIKPTDIDKKIFNVIDANKYTLSSQFRVKAGKDYPKYMEDVLKQRTSTSQSFSGYDLRLFDDVNYMVEAIKDKNRKYGLSRNVAGFSWKWSKNDKTKKDVVINKYAYKWNTSSSDWINSKDAIHEIGCIHTIQGYDLNYCGVIIGNDLIYKNGKITYNPDGYKDVNAKDLTLSQDQMLDYIVNIYKVLLTRGILGTYIYVCDDGLREYLKGFV